MFINAPKRFPVKLTIFATGREVALFWVDFASDWIEYAETQAARMANEHGQEIDILTGSVMPSGRVAEWNREGLRVRPS